MRLDRGAKLAVVRHRRPLLAVADRPLIEYRVCVHVQDRAGEYSFEAEALAHSNPLT